MDMNKQHSSKSTLFLMELVVVIFFFSICAAICVNVFGSAQMMAKDSYNLSNAVMTARSAASCYKAADGDLAQTAALLDGVQDAAQCLVYYDGQWQQTEEPVQDGFTVQIEAPKKRGEAVIVVQDCKRDTAIFELPVKAAGGGDSREG